MNAVNFWAVLVAAASSFLLGGLWYSPLMFLKIWSREWGLGDTPPKGGHPAKVFGISFVFSLISAYVFALWLGSNPELQSAIHKGFLVGFGFVAASFGINYQFANRSFKLWLIDAGYHVFQFVLYGVVLGLWPRN
jgi:Protein of unknown function (DUF1761)